MRIIPNQTFLHERERYEDGREYDVPDHLGFYFVQSGWADSDKEIESEVQPDEVDLDVQNATLSTKANLDG